MFDIIGKRKYGYILSGILVSLGLFFILATLIPNGNVGLQFSIAYTGGTVWEVHFEEGGDWRAQEMRRESGDGDYFLFVGAPVKKSWISSDAPLKSTVSRESTASIDRPESCAMEQAVTPRRSSAVYPCSRAMREIAIWSRAVLRLGNFSSVICSPSCSTGC